MTSKSDIQAVFGDEVPFQSRPTPAPARTRTQPTATPQAIQPRRFKKPSLRARGRPAHWTYATSTPATRRDQLNLRRWRRETHASSTTPPQTADRFAKYDVAVSVPAYDPDTYDNHLTHSDWTKDDTDSLVEIYRDCNGKWPVIVDRYTSTTPRTMEDLKWRYYAISSKLLSIQTPITSMTGPEYDLYHMLQSFDPLKEASRKKLAEGHLSRPRNEVDEETVLLGELQRIMLHQATLDAEREVSSSLPLPPPADADCFVGPTAPPTPPTCRYEWLPVLDFAGTYHVMATATSGRPRTESAASATRGYATTAKPVRCSIATCSHSAERDADGLVESRSSALWRRPCSGEASYWCHFRIRPIVKAEGCEVHRTDRQDCGDLDSHWRARSHTLAHSCGC